MKIYLATCIVLEVVIVACCREIVSEDPIQKNISGSGVSKNALSPQRFTAGTVIGLVVASLVVVIGSFLVMWRLCCDYDVVTSGNVSPLRSISLAVAETPRTIRSQSTGSGQLLVDSSESSDHSLESI